MSLCQRKYLVIGFQLLVEHFVDIQVSTNICSILSTTNTAIVIYVVSLNRRNQHIGLVSQHACGQIGKENLDDILKIKSTI